MLLLVNNAPAYYMPANLRWDCVFIRFINSKLNVPSLVVKLNQKTN